MNDWANLKSVYAGFVVFAALRGTKPLPVAGILELITELLEQKRDDLPWTLLTTSSPAPVWLLAKLLRPVDVQGGPIRVLGELRSASLQKATTMGDYLGQWMYARAHRRI